jgi:predicted RNA polymerase sigma factor
VVAEVEGAAAGLARLDALAGDRFQPARAARAHLLERLGRVGEAVAAYRMAIELTSDPAERDYLKERLVRLAG